MNSMWQTIWQVALAVGAVWTIAALAARSARKDEQLKQKQQKERESEKVDEILADTGGLGRDECLKRLRNSKDK